VADRVVLDASFALAYLLDEVGTPAARDAVTQWANSSTQLLVPSNFWLEVTNALVRGNGLSPAELITEFVDLDQLGLTTIEPDRPLLLLALDQMARSRLTAYDAIYLALALATDSKLATLDRRLAEAAGDAGMLVGSGGSGRISDVPWPYGAGPRRFLGPGAHRAGPRAELPDPRPCDRPGLGQRDLA